MKISAVVITKNEKNNLFRCLKSINFCDEIIIIDDYSVDGTTEEIYKLRKKLNLKNLILFRRHLNEDFSSQRNFGLEKARGEWVLFIDADEEVSFSLRKEIVDLLEKQQAVKKISAFYIKRRDFFWGKEIKFGEVWNARKNGLIRLVRKNSGQWQGKVHETFKISNLKFKTQKLKNYLNHYPHQNLREFLKEINFYSSVKAKELFNQGKKVNLLEIFLWPTAKFFVNYFLKFGFLDGVAGFVYAFFMSFHSFLIRSKLFLFNIKSKWNHSCFFC